MNKPQNILICPLEWGLGHAARMIPLARKLLDSGHRVSVAAGEEHLSLFRAELKGLDYISFPGFRPGYSRIFPQYLAMLFKTPLLLFHIIRDHKRLQRIVAAYNVDIVISDNRFGCWSNTVKSVYVTHMPRIPLPEILGFLEFVGVVLHRYIMKKYTLCFIPDLPGEVNLSGRLSHDVDLPHNTRFIGYLSRFTNINIPEDSYKFSHNTVILSGPEPQRSIFRKKILSALRKKNEKTVVLEGRPGRNKDEFSENLISHDHLPLVKFGEMLKSSHGIVSRSGYTTIMDLVALGLNALLVPTPGQTEQEYLAEYMAANGWFRTISQREIGDGLVLPDTMASWSAVIRKRNEGLLEKALNELLEEV